MACILKALPIVLAGFAFAAPQVASACEPRKICFHWLAAINDDGFGIEIGKEVRASGARITLIRPAPEPPVVGFLDEEGCMAFESQFAEGHKAVVYADAWVGTPRQRIRAFWQRFETTTFNLDKSPYWVVDLVGLAPNDNDVVPFPINDKDDANPVAVLMAILTAVMNRFDELGVIPLVPPAGGYPLIGFPGVTAFAKNWEGGAQAGCETAVFGPESYQDKFVIGHEMGHWLQCNWDANVNEGGYEYEADSLPCMFKALDNVENLDGVGIPKGNIDAHGLRSAEYSGAAFAEGFAQFVASVLFNPIDTADADGIFRYYKEIDPDEFDGAYEDLVIHNYMVSLEGNADLGGQNGWAENQCNMDWIKGAVSTELDWMRFLWRFLMKAGTRPTFREILEFFAYVKEDPDNAFSAFGGFFSALSHCNTWPGLDFALDWSIEYNQFRSRFQEANDVMGVYNGSTCP